MSVSLEHAAHYTHCVMRYINVLLTYLLTYPSSPTDNFWIGPRSHPLSGILSYLLESSDIGWRHSYRERGASDILLHAECISSIWQII